MSEKEEAGETEAPTSQLSEDVVELGRRIDGVTDKVASLFENQAASTRETFDNVINGLDALATQKSR